MPAIAQHSHLRNQFSPTITTTIDALHKAFKTVSPRHSAKVTVHLDSSGLCFSQIRHGVSVTAMVAKTAGTNVVPPSESGMLIDAVRLRALLKRGQSALFDHRHTVQVTYTAGGLSLCQGKFCPLVSGTLFDRAKPMATEAIVTGTPLSSTLRDAVGRSLQVVRYAAARRTQYGAPFVGIAKDGLVASAAGTSAVIEVETGFADAIAFNARAAAFLSNALRYIGPTAKYAVSDDTLVIGDNDMAISIALLDEFPGIYFPRSIAGRSWSLYTADFIKNFDLLAIAHPGRPRSVTAVLTSVENSDKLEIVSRSSASARGLVTLTQGEGAAANFACSTHVGLEPLRNAARHCLSEQIKLTLHQSGRVRVSCLDAASPLDVVLQPSLALSNFATA